MRIAELVNSLEIGGAERIVVDLTTGLHARGHRLHVVCLRGSGPLAAPLQARGIEIHALEKGNGFQWQVLTRLTTFLRERQIDVIHTHNPLVHHYGAMAARLAGTTVVVNTIHGLENVAGAGAGAFLFRMANYMTSRVVAVCRTAEDFFARRAVISRDRLVTIYNGIPLDSFLNVPRRRPSSEFVFGAVGRLVPVKDHQSLLTAFAEVRREQPHCRLEIVGDGPLRVPLQNLARQLGVEAFVTFRGSLLDVAGALGQIDAFVLSSTSEGLPVTVLEAMAAGLPIVATAVGGVPELVGSARCGWLCPPSRPDLLATAMLHALRCQDLLEMGCRARAEAARSYSAARMAEQYESLFREIRESAGNGRRIH